MKIIETGLSCFPFSAAFLLFFYFHHLAPGIIATIKADPVR
jgi:hypothetical protein